MNSDKALKTFKQDIRKIILPNKELTCLDRIKLLENTYNSFILSKFKDSKEISNNIHFFWEIIKECVNLHQRGLFADALILFYDKIFSNELYVDTVTIDVKSKFYRIRKAEYGGLYTQKEMFHIPFTKRHIVANERFSVTGMPSLYLSESTYICWEEMGNPDFDTCNVSLFMNEVPLNLINLVPIMESFEKKLVLKYPLAYLCSLSTNYTDSAYKEEYIIPQLLMQAILKSNNTSNSKYLSGIRYISTKAYTERPLFPLNEKKDLRRYFNYVFPATSPYDENGLSGYLTKSFSWSSPDTFGRYKLRTDGMSKTETRTTETYKVSAFFQMEQWCYIQWTRDNMSTYNSFQGALTF